MKPVFEMKLSAIRGWYYCAPKVWYAIGIGWLWVILFPFPASGSILVGTAIVADLFYGQLEFRKLDRRLWGRMMELPRNVKQSSLFADRSLPISDFTEKKISNEISGLLRISKNSDWENGESTQNFEDVITGLQSSHRENDDQTEADFWEHGKTIARVEKVILWWIGVSAVSGTVIWGYGSCFVQWINNAKRILM